MSTIGSNAATRTRVGPSLLILFLLSLVLVLPATAMQDTEFEEKLALARELNVTAPISESQRIIDILRARQDQATARQRADVELLHIRNLALRGNYSEAIHLLYELLEEPPELDPDQRLIALRTAANLNLNIGRFEPALDYLNQGLALLAEVPDPAEHATLLGLAGFFHSQAGNLEQALNYTERALEMAYETADPREICFALQRRAVSWARVGDFERQAAAAEEGLAVCRQTGDLVMIGMLKHELGEAALALGDINRARHYHELSLSYLDNDGYADGLLNARLLRARLLAHHQQFDQALELIQELIDENRRRELWGRLATVHELAADIHVQQDRPQAATEHLLESLAAHQQFLNRQQLHQQAWLAQDFASHQGELDLAILRERARADQLQQEAARRDRWIRTTVQAGLGLLAAGMFILLLRTGQDRRRFRQLARRDGLTGLYNHSAFFEHLTLALGRHHADGPPLTLVLADIDHFKRVNDRYGHQTGDQVLRRTAGRLMDTFGQRGFLGRIGGEEFAIVLPGHDTEAAMAHIEQLRRSLNRARADDNDVGISMSFGLAQAWPGETATQLHQRADRALYDAKHAGRNCLRVDPSPTP